MRRNLVIVRAGDQSLHPQWIKNNDRNWDLAVSYYGDFPARYQGQYDYLETCKGSKWEGIAHFFNAHQELISAYDYVWLPDDDLFIAGEHIDLFFSVCNLMDLTIAQPALTPYSFYSWDITLQRPDLIGRITNFVEIMAPCFKGKNLALFSKHFGENTSGWGYEWLWKKIADENNLSKLGIVDLTPVFHTRPVGSASHGGSKYAPQEELSQLFKKFNLERGTPQTLTEVRQQDIFSHDRLPESG